MRKIAYVTSSRIPSRAANTVHVVNMCAAFAEAGAKVTLFARGTPGPARPILDDFGVTAEFELDLYPVRRPPMLDRLIFLRHLRSRLASGGYDFAYGRSPSALLAGVPGKVPFAYDLHFFPLSRAQLQLEAMLFKRRNFLFATAITRALVDKYEQTFPHLRGRILLAPCAATPARELAPPPAGEPPQRPLRV
ncbi:MAG TPA: glycosyltransferase, partial [Allosphingosinicella sp.]